MAVGGRGSEPTISDAIPLEAFRRLYRFSAHIARGEDLKGLERNLVDAVIELASADAGTLLATELGGGPLRVEIARSAAGEDLPVESLELSASMIDEVVETRRPLLVRNALEDDAFAERRSVVDYRLRSVLAVPVLRGETLLGVLYLSCDRSAAFTPTSLEILAVFAAQAGLLLHDARLLARLERDNRALAAELDKRSFGEIIGGCAAMQEVFRTASRIAPTDITVLIRGETGTGKELFARALHARSRRATGPFVAINMAAIPEPMLEAELFGHVKGAFTGAISDRKGKLAEAHGGTLFLDEIGDIPLGLQAKLLRVLQERVVTPVGSNREQDIDVRILGATHRDLETLRDEGQLREDLYYRLDEVQLRLPPLREREEDIELLARWFLTTHGRAVARPGLGLSKAAILAMESSPWRGNVRELEARIKKAVVLADGPELEPSDLGLDADAAEPILPLRDAKEHFATSYVKKVLALNGGNRSQTARDLGVDPRTIYKYLEGR